MDHRKESGFDDGHYNAQTPRLVDRLSAHSGPESIDIEEQISSIDEELEPLCRRLRVVQDELFQLLHAHESDEERLGLQRKDGEKERFLIRMGRREAQIRGHEQ